MLNMNAINNVAACARIYWAKALFLCFFTLFLAACTPDKPQFKSIDLTGADYAKDFVLPDQNGKTRAIRDFAGKVVVVFFGFTQCPDVCPTSMTELADIKKSLGADGDKLFFFWKASGHQRGRLMNIPPTGKFCSFLGSTFLSLKEGKIYRSRRIWDVATMLRQIGLLPEPTTAQY